MFDYLFNESSEIGIHVMTVATNVHPGDHNFFISTVFEGLNLGYDSNRPAISRATVTIQRVH